MMKSSIKKCHILQIDDDPTNHRYLGQLIKENFNKSADIMVCNPSNEGFGPLFMKDWDAIFINHHLTGLESSWIINKINSYLSHKNHKIYLYHQQLAPFFGAKRFWELGVNDILSRSEIFSYDGLSRVIDDIESESLNTHLFV